MASHFPAADRPALRTSIQLGRFWFCVVLVALVMATAAVATGPHAKAASGSVSGYPRCTIDEVAQDWVWYEGTERIATTSEPILEHDGAVHEAATDCSGVAPCLALHPDVSGRAATIVGGAGDDHLIGTPGRDLIVGLAGDDQLTGRGGKDTICGGPGDDVIDGGASDDQVIAGAGDDIVRGKRGDDVIRAGPGFDVMYGGDGHDLMRGGTGDDWALGGPGQDEIAGGPGDDACFGGPRRDRLQSCRVSRQGTVRYGGGDRVRLKVVMDSGTGVPKEQFAAQVDRTLGDPRSWIGGAGELGFERVTADPDLIVILARPETVDELCFPLRTGGVLSCRNGDKVVINLNRWQLAVAHWTASILEYRHYVINHEVGHFLGHGHVSCPGPGQLAPVMLQQTKSLGGCLPNGWPYP